MVSDWAAAINERLLTREVFRYYGITLNIKGYCKCPFHSGGNEKTPSMFVYPKDRGYHCFACGETGDSIDFVKKYFNISFKDACRKMNQDFRLGLPLDGEINVEERRRINREAYLRRKAREREEAEQKRVLDAYYDALDCYTYFDRVIAEREADGCRTPSRVFSDDEYMEALKNIDGARYRLDCAETELHEFEMKRKGA